MHTRRRSAFAVPSGFCVSRVKIRTAGSVPQQDPVAPGATVAGETVPPAVAR